jgi:uncharacterized membrane protein YesL
MGTAHRFLWCAYDHLGGLVVLNLLWALLALPWLAAAVWLLGLGSSLSGAWAAAGRVGIVLLAAELVLVSPPTVLLFLAAARWARGEPATVRRLLGRLPRFCLRAQLLGLALVAVSLLLMVNAVFYLHWRGWVGLGLAGLMLWLLVVVGLIAPYILPVLVTQDVGVWRTLRLSAQLALGNLGRSAVLLAAVLSSGLIGVCSGVGLVAGGLAALALWVSIYFRQLVARYTGQPVPEEPPRRWRELVRPWEE